MSAKPLVGNWTSGVTVVKKIFPGMAPDAGLIEGPEPNIYE